jgi:N-acetylglucosaminyldiphosphoundecaprenol N-acetyl-beta-D-mannosaminyltransferase
MRRMFILDTPLTAQRFDEAVFTLVDWMGEGGSKRYVSLCTVYTMMLARRTPQVMRALEGAHMVVADGMPIVWVQRKKGHTEADRIYGPDVLVAVCEQTSNSDLRHFFLGGLPGVAEKLADELTNRFPCLQIAGVYSPPINAVGNAPDPEVVDLLNNSNADVIWVGLGSPKQDVWMSLYRPELDAPLLIGIGAAFDFLSGTKRQAPIWMRRNGIEWLFRLVQEPRRLWRRYFVYNTLFI